MYLMVCQVSGHSPLLAQLACDFCTMKFSSIPLMFHHMKTAHLDRVNSPNTYMDHLNRLQIYGQHLQHVNGIPSPFAANDNLNQSPDNVHPSFETPIKSERSVSTGGNSTVEDDVQNEVDAKQTQSLTEARIKVEDEQDAPTDLSNKPHHDNEDEEDEVNSNEDRRSSNPQSIPPSPTNIHREPAVGNFLCSQCNAALPDFEAFRNHLKDHLTSSNSTRSSSVDPPAHTCPQCGNTFPSPSELERHVLSHYLITTTEFYCNFTCNQTFAASDDLQRHLLERHAQSLFKCGICSDLFDTKVAMQVHFAVAHANEIKLYRCSACMENFRTEPEFRHHVKTRHIVTTIPQTTLQCVFCRTVCANEVEMHFHLAAHARQFRCPSCPEAFHVEFLLDRHIQAQHGSSSIPNGHTLKEHTSAYLLKPSSHNTNNNNVLDYHYATLKGMYNNQTNHNNNHINGVGHKFYHNAIPRLDDSTSVPKNALCGFYDALHKSRYDADSAKNLLGMYRSELAAKLYAAETDRDMNLDAKRNPSSVYFASLPTGLKGNIAVDNGAGSGNTDAAGQKFACGICDKQDFVSECELHTHRKVEHNVKTGVSLKCAYCNGNFRSR